MIHATLVGPERAELHADGAPGVLVCDYSGVTGEWTAVEVRLHDGGTLPATGGSLNDEALAALDTASAA